MNVRQKSRFTRIFLTSILIVSFTDLRAQVRDRMMVSFENQRRAASLSTVRKESVLYASLEEFSQLLNIKHFYNPQNKKLVMTVGSRSIKVTALNPFIIVDNMAYQLALPTLIVDGHVYAPLALFLQSMGGFFPAEFHLNLNTEELDIRRFRIKNFRQSPFLLYKLKQWRKYLLYFIQVFSVPTVNTEIRINISAYQPRPHNSLMVNTVSFYLFSICFILSLIFFIIR